MDPVCDPEFQLQRRATPRGEVLSVAGVLDAATISALRQALLATIDASPAVLVIDLTEVAFIDSEGLGTLVAAAKRAETAGVNLRLVTPESQVCRVLQITGLIRMLPVYETLEAALGTWGDS